MVSPTFPNRYNKDKSFDRQQESTSSKYSNPDKNFGLSPADFEQLLRQLNRGDESLYERIFLAHFGDCMQYLKMQCKASHNDAYDATMEATALFLERLQAGKVSYGNLRFLFTRMAVQIYFRWVKNIQSPLLCSLIDIGEEEASYEPLLPLLKTVWPLLQAKDRSLLEAFYFEGRTLKTLAQCMGTTPATLRKRKQRGLERLRILFLAECKRTGL